MKATVLGKVGCPGCGKPMLQSNWVDGTSYLWCCDELCVCNEKRFDVPVVDIHEVDKDVE